MECILYMKETVVITGNTAFESIYKYTEIDNADIEYAYNGSDSIILSFIRIIWMKLNLPFKKMWYKKINLSKYRSIVIFDTYIDSDYLHYIDEETNENQKKHLYFWNVYKNARLKKKDIEAYNFKIWSFDYADCKKYGFNYNPQFYAKSWYKDINVEPNVDVIFIGRDKGDRVEKVDEIVKKLERQGIKCRTYITAGKWYKHFQSKRYQRYLDFKEMIEKECEGRVILDYGVNEQYGPTLRVYDAVCNERKVITNNKGVKKLEFYSKDNFFILGEDREEDLVEFVLKPISIYNKTLSNYSCERWVERFV